MNGSLATRAINEYFFSAENSEYFFINSIFDKLG